MSPEEFKKWQADLNLNDDQAAEELGVAATTIRNYKRGARDGGARTVEIPKVVELACECIAIRRML